MQERLFSLYRRLTSGTDVHWALVPVGATVRWTVLFYQQLQRDQAFVRSAGMAYMTLVALVPLLMLVFGVLHGFGLLAGEAGDELLGGPLGALLFGTMLGDIPEVREFLLPGLMQVDLGALGLLGVGGLVVIAVRLFMMVEKAYNDIFGVHIDRSLGYRVLNFYFAITMLPLVVVVAFLGADEFGIHFPLSPDWLQRGLTFGFLLIALKAFPCTRVRWRASIAGASVSWVLLQAGGMIFPLYLRWFASDDPLIAIYGTIGLVPVFLLWLYCLWIFVLLGVEVAYVAQNFNGLVAAENDEWDRRRAILRAPSVETAIEAAVRVAWAFDRGKGPVDIEPLALLCEVPVRELHMVLRVLERGGILVRSDQGGWLPSRRTDAISLGEVVDVWRELTSLRNLGNDPIGDEVAESLKELLDGTLAEGFDRWVPEGETEMLPMPTHETEGVESKKG